MIEYLKFLLIYLTLASVIILCSNYYSFFDNPNSKRKIHSVSTLNTGGLIICLFFLVTIFLEKFNPKIELIVLTGVIICAVGFIDDRIDLTPSIKVALIILPSIFLIFNGISITDLGVYEYIGKINLGNFSIPFLILAIGLLINATNYIDGVDGLLLVFFSSCLIYYMFLIEDNSTIKLIKIFIIPVILNLILNLLPVKTKLKIFNGNTGSLFIGFFISFITIELYGGYNIHPAFLIWPLWYPVYDFLFVSIYRLIKKKSIFDADNSHLHHYMLKKFNNNHLKTIIVFFSFNSLIIYFGYFVSDISKFLSLIMFALIFLVYFFLRINLKIENHKKN